MAWSTPKTDWIVSDRFNITDYNRIKNNIQWLLDKTEELLVIALDYDEMGADKSGYLGCPDFNIFNAFEDNIDLVNHTVLYKDYGDTKTFYANGQFIDYVELNRIESATLGIKATVDGLEAGISNKHLAFTLGQYDAVKI